MTVLPIQAGAVLSAGQHLEDDVIEVWRSRGGCTGRGAQPGAPTGQPAEGLAGARRHADKGTRAEGHHRLQRLAGVRAAAAWHHGNLASPDNVCPTRKLCLADCIASDRFQVLEARVCKEFARLCSASGALMHKEQ